MKKIYENITNTIIVEKSKFITTIYKVNTVDEINEILKEVNKKYYDATHNCYAYILDNGNIQKASDDGEPAKTAGYPMLDILKKNDLTNVLAVTTRYFGGIKLGAGGLTRTYAESVVDCLKNAKFSQDINYNVYEFWLDYSEYNKFINTLNMFKITTLFTDRINIKIYLKNENLSDFETQLITLTNGREHLNYLYSEISEELIK